MINNNSDRKQILIPQKRNIISLEEVLSFFIRNKINIGIFTILTTLFSLFIPLNYPWSVKTSIIFENEKDYSFISGYSSEYFIEGIKNPYENVFAGFQIINDDGFLIKIYNFYKEQKILYGENDFYSFNRWKRNFNFKLDKRGKLINITFKDVNKEIASKVVDLILENYKDLANEYMILNLNESLVTYDLLKEEYELKSEDALKNLQAFNEENNLRKKGFASLYLQIIKDLGTKESIPLSITIEETGTKNDYNSGEFAQLIRDASLYVSILNRIYFETELIKVELGIQKDPWLEKGDNYLNLNKNPTRISILIIGLISGSLIGIILNLIKENKSDFIYSSNELKENYPYPFLGEINTLNKKSYLDNLNFIKSFYFKNIKERILFISPSKINDEILSKLKNQLEYENIEITYQNINLSKSENNFLLIHKGFSKRKTLDKIIHQVSLIKVPIKGILMLSSD